jgi:hypothetical protein
MATPLKVLVFGATGMAGNAVTRACLDLPMVDEVRVIVRRPLDYQHEKLRVTLHDDFLDFSKVQDVFRGVDGCFFCLGISSTQVSGEAEYKRISHDFPVAAARMLRAQSPDAAFHYISGQGTNVKSRLMWSRVKGAAERELMLGGGVCWRPAIIEAEPSASTPAAYKIMRPLLKLAKGSRKFYVTGEDLGHAMVEATIEKMRSCIVENPDIRELASRLPV